jgi:hypothetical protein
MPFCELCYDIGIHKESATKRLDMHVCLSCAIEWDEWHDEDEEFDAEMDEWLEEWDGTFGS